MKPVEEMLANLGYVSCRVRINAIPGSIPEILYEMSARRTILSSMVIVKMETKIKKNIFNNYLFYFLDPYNNK